MSDHLSRSEWDAMSSDDQYEYAYWMSREADWFNALLEVIPECPTHGHHCPSHAHEWVEAAKKVYHEDKPMTETPKPDRYEVKTLCQRLYADDNPAADTELARYLSEGWEQIDITILPAELHVALGPERIVTLKRETDAWKEYCAADDARAMRAVMQGSRSRLP